MYKSASWYFVTIFVFTFFLFGCQTQQQPTANDTDANKIRFGVIVSTTGVAASYGADNLRGVQIAQEKINEQGGINGKAVELDVQDSTGDNAQAVSIAQRFAADPAISAILGPTRTGETVAIAKLLPQLQLVMMSIGSTGDWKSAGGEFNEWTFRSTRVDTPLILPLLRAARDKFNVKRVAIMTTANDDSAKSLLPVYQEAIQNLGLEMVATESQMAGDTDRSAQLSKIKAANPDALILNTPTDAPAIADQARQAGIQARFIGTSGFANPAMWKAARDVNVLNGTLLAENFFAGSERPAVKDFVERYKKKFGGDAPPPYSAYGYDGAMLVFDAIKRAQNPRDRKAIRDALGSTSNFDGVLGTLTYKDRGDAEKQPIILSIEKGQYVELK
ncbi:MAG TPA: ABC transporter substrate-binding protein [Pyrinomonadaceae bacterium]